MWKALGQNGGRPYQTTAYPESGPGKPCNMGIFRGLIFHTSPPFFSHILPLLPPQGDPGTGLGAVGQPPIHRDGPAADRANLKIRPGPLGQESGLQRRIEGQDGLPEIAAVSARPAFAEHIALTLQGQAPIFLVIVGAPFCHQSADFLFFLACQFTGHGFTSRQRFSKVPGNRTHSRSPASRDTRNTGSPWALSGQTEPWAAGAASSFFHRGCL